VPATVHDVEQSHLAAAVEDGRLGHHGWQEPRLWQRHRGDRAARCLGAAAQAFRISVRATGLRTSTVVILQSTYIKR
jgi:Tfp pilus assembly protein PilX